MRFSLPRLDDNWIILDRSVKLGIKKMHGIVEAQVWLLVGWTYRHRLPTSDSTAGDVDYLHVVLSFDCARTMATSWISPSSLLGATSEDRKPHPINKFRLHPEIDDARKTMMNALETCDGFEREVAHKNRPGLAERLCFSLEVVDPEKISAEYASEVNKDKVLCSIGRCFAVVACWGATFMPKGDGILSLPRWSIQCWRFLFVWGSSRLRRTCI